MHAGLRGYGFLEASWAVGGVLGAVIATWASQRFRMWQLQLISLLGSGLAIASMPLVANLTESILALVFSSVVITLMNIPFMSALQLLAPEELRGRIMAAFGLFAGVGDPLGLFAGSWLMGRFSPSSIFLSSGLLLALCSIMGILFPALRTGTDQLGEKRRNKYSEASKINLP